MNHEPTKLTEIVIRALKPEAKPYVVVDTDIPGFGIRVSNGGTKSFTYVYFLHGRRGRKALGRYPHVSLAAARAAALLMQGDVKGRKKKPEDVVPSRPEPVGFTFKELVAKYRASDAFTKLAPGTQRLIGYYIDRDMVPLYGDRGLSTITSAEIHTNGKRLAEKAEHSANHVFTYMRRIWGWGMSEPDLQVPMSPFIGLKKPAKLDPNVLVGRVLTPAEISTVFNVGLLEEPRDLFGWWLLMFLFATRKGETITVEKHEVWKSDRGLVWMIPAAKNKPRRDLYLPITQIAKKAFDHQLAFAGSSFYFPTPGGDEVRSADTGNPPQRVKDRTGINFSPHDIRTTVATIMGEVGVDPHIIDSIQNHALPTDTRVTTIYNRARAWAYFEAKREALDKWQSHLDKKILGGKLEKLMEKGFTAKRKYEDRIMAGVKVKRESGKMFGK